MKSLCYVRLRSTHVLSNMASLWYRVNQPRVQSSVYTGQWFLTQNFMLILKFHFLNASDAAFSQNIAFCVFFSYINGEMAILPSDTV